MFVKHPSASFLSDTAVFFTGDFFASAFFFAISCLHCLIWQMQYARDFDNGKKLGDIFGVFRPFFSQGSQRRRKGRDTRIPLRRIFPLDIPIAAFYLL